MRHDIAFEHFESPIACGERVLGPPLESLLRAGSGLIMVRGLPGSGVSRVVHGTLTLAGRQGAATAACTLEEWDRHAPYALLEQIAAKVATLQPLADELTPEASPLDITRVMIRLLSDAREAGAESAVAGTSQAPGTGEGAGGAEATTAKADDGRPWPIVVGIDNLARCDELSSIVISSFLTRSAGCGIVFVVGDNLVESSRAVDYAARFAETDPAGHLFVIPELPASAVSAAIRERTGVGVSQTVAEGVARLTAGRFEALVAYLDGVSERELDDLAAIQVLPTTTSARLLRHHAAVFAELSESARFTAELCALTVSGVPLELLLQTAKLLEFELRLDEAVDGLIVVQHLYTGAFYLRDPLTAADVRAAADPDRIRALHRVLADTTYGTRSLEHRILQLETIDDAAADWIIESATELEATRRGSDAVRLLELASRSSRGEAAERLLLAFGLMAVRQIAVVQYQAYVSTFAERAARDADPRYGFVEVWLRSAKAFGMREARAARLAYIDAAPIDDDHRLMQADVAFLEFLSSALTGADGQQAFTDARSRWMALRGVSPSDAELAWLEPEPRLVQLEAIAAAAAIDSLPAERAALVARGVASRARSMPEHVAEAATVLVTASVMLLAINDLDEADAVLEEVEVRHRSLTRPLLAPGQFTIGRCLVALRSGRWLELRDIIEEALDSAFDHYDAPARAALLALYAWVQAVSARRKDAHRILELAEQIDVDDYPSLAIDALVGARAELLRLDDRLDDAIEVVERGLESPRFRGSIMLRSMLVDLLAEQGMAQQARDAHRIFRELVRSRTPHETTEFTWLDARLADAVGDVDEAVRLYHEAIDTSPSPFVRGKCYLGLAQVLSRSRGARETLRDALVRSQHAFSSIGADAYTAVAAAFAEHIESEWESLATELSPRERQVAELAAEGKTNKQIAQELEVSVATVAFHLSNVFQKIGIAKRSELPAALQMMR